MSKELQCNGDDTEFFDIPQLREHFQNCLLDDEDIDIDAYLEAYKGLIKFCNLMGNVFSFVRDEIESKSQVLLDLKSQRAEEFKSLKKMVRYEMEANLLDKRDYVSGSRTFLRLHWGLDFLRKFLKRVHELEPDAKTSTVGREVYEKTLGTHHAWYLRMIVPAAMTLLPVKKQFVLAMCGGEMEKSTLEAMPTMLEACNEVYNRTEAVFKNNELIDLE